MKYAKLSTALLDSTIWREPDTTRLVWITLLAMADWDGNVFAAIPGLADRARVSLEACEQALECLLGPDAYSRTPENDGRRIEKVRGGWRILNYVEHRDAGSKETERNRTRERVRRFRDRKRDDDNASPVTSRDVTHRHEPSRTVTDGNGEPLQGGALCNGEPLQGVTGNGQLRHIDKDLYKSKALAPPTVTRTEPDPRLPPPDLTPRPFRDDDPNRYDAILFAEPAERSEEQEQRLAHFLRMRDEAFATPLESGSPDESEQHGQGQPPEALQ